MSNRVDLSNLPYPDFLQELDFEQILQECKADFVSRFPEMADTVNLESEPVTKLLETFAYRLMIKTHEMNSQAKALTLAYATGADLDHLAVNRDVYRLLIQAENNAVIPPIPAIYESDEALRRRVQLSVERQSAGSTGAYQYWALSADGDVRDVSIVTEQAGRVEIYVQSHSQAIAPQSLLDKVNTALDPRTNRPATDDVHVFSATPQDFTISATLVLFAGPDADVVLQTAKDELQKYLDKVGYLGFDVTISGIHHALHQGGVQRVILHEPTADIVISPKRYARCIAQNIAKTEYRDV